ncbi:MAG: hypothetical protein U0795_12835 [Pirellulales bacterium]
MARDAADTLIDRLTQQGLFTASQSARLVQQIPAAELGSIETALKWLVQQRQITGFHAAGLVANPGPSFLRGPFKLLDRYASGPCRGHYQAIHLPTRHPVRLWDARTGCQNGRPSPEADALISRLKTVRDTRICRIWGYEPSADSPLWIADPVAGRSASELVTAGRPLAVGMAIEVVLAVLDALRALRDAGVCHDQVRPETISVRWQAERGSVQLLTDPLLAGQPAGDILAQLDYLAPELFDERARETGVIYAVGATLYHLLAGCPPLTGATRDEKLTAHRQLPVPSLTVTRRVPAELDRVVQFLLAKRVDRRVPTFEAAAELLQPWRMPESGRPQLERPTPPTQAAFAAWLADHGPAVTGRPAVRAETPALEGMAVERMAVERMAVERMAVERMAVERMAVERIAGPAVVRVVEESRGAVRNTGRRGRADRSVWRHPAVWSGAAAAGLVLAGLVWYLIGTGGSTAPPDRLADSTGQPKANGGTVSPSATVDGAPTTAEPDTGGDGRGVVDGPPEDTSSEALSGGGAGGGELWASPTSGPPLELNWLPADGQLVMRVRVADLLSTDEGRRVWQALGPDFSRRVTAWCERLEWRPEQLDVVWIAWSPSDTQWPLTTFVCYPVETRDQVPEAWAKSAPESTSAGPLYVANEDTGLLVPEATGAPWIVGPVEVLREIAADQGAAPLVRRQWTELLRATDADRQLNLIMAPDFLGAEGRELLAGPWAGVREGIGSWWTDALQAVLISAHVNADDFYGEMRVVGEPQRDPFELGRQLRDRVGQLPATVRQWLVDRVDPYWQELALAYPAMIAYLHQQTRVAVEGEQAVLNFALPAPAAHNLVLATELAFTSPRGVSAPAAAVAEAEIDSLDKLLQMKISIEIPQQSLESTLEEVAVQVRGTGKGVARDFKVNILGEDLRREGITRNQQIRNLVVHDLPLADVLNDIVRRANPVTTVKSLTEKDQKLVWLPDPDPSAGPAHVIVTTRAAAEEQKWELPLPFRSSQAP